MMTNWPKASANLAASQRLNKPAADQHSATIGSADIERAAELPPTIGHAPAVSPEPPRCDRLRRALIPPTQPRAN
jgi:hypothetical protein